MYLSSDEDSLILLLASRFSEFDYFCRENKTTQASLRLRGYLLLQLFDLLSQLLRPRLKIRQFVAHFLRHVRGCLILPMVLQPPSSAAIWRAIRAEDGAVSVTPAARPALAASPLWPESQPVRRALSAPRWRALISADGAPAAVLGGD
jgi:hypothetical protein